MKILQLQTESTVEEQPTLLYATCRDVLAGTGLWYILVRFSSFLGLPFQNLVSGYVACGVVAILLPTAWYASRRESKAAVLNR